MKINQRTFIFSILFVLSFYFLTLYKIPFYIYKPGSADSLDEVVKVDNENKSSGNFHLVTVSSGQASLVTSLIALAMPEYELRKAEDIFPEGIDEDEYYEAQLELMENSHQAAIAVAYEKANANIKFNYDGVYVVNVIENTPAEHIFKPRDKILQIDDQKIAKAEDIISYLDTKQEGDSVTVHFIRKNKTRDATLHLERINQHSIKEKIGLGVQLITKKDVEVDPNVEISSGKIGGSSAGLMFALEIYDQLTGEDLTKGKKIIGTGEIDYEGNVHQIGGVDKKVVAAHKKGCEIFFVPGENSSSQSNYNVAKQKAKELNTTMKIVPVNHFDEALNYLKKM